MTEDSQEFKQNISLCNDPTIASPLAVAVMTVCGELNSHIHLVSIFDLYNKGLCDERFKLNYVPNSKKSKIENKHKAFYNCLSVIFKHVDTTGVTSNISAKIFPNGSVQLPGCRTIESVSEAPKVLCDFIQKISIDHPNVVDNPPRLSNVRIVMINSNFSFGADRKITQERMKNIINDQKFDGVDMNKQWRMATYQPEKYAGVNIRYWTQSARERYKTMVEENRKLPKKIEGQISIFVFRSGKATITAAKNSKDLLDAYRAICDFVKTNNTS